MSDSQGIPPLDTAITSFRPTAPSPAAPPKPAFPWPWPRWTAAPILVGSHLLCLLAGFFFAAGGGFAGPSKVVQEGRLTVAPGLEREVFYTIPYASPPNLRLDGDINWRVVKIEQKAECFKIVCNATEGSSELHWRAEGERKA